jgi:hypothetical protein
LIVNQGKLIFFKKYQYVEKRCDKMCHGFVKWFLKRRRDKPLPERLVKLLLWIARNSPGALIGYI